MNIFSKVLKKMKDISSSVKVQEPVEEVVEETSTPVTDKVRKDVVELLDVLFRDYPITQKYGWTPFALKRKKLHEQDKEEWMYRYGIHTGIDIGMPMGTPVKCPIDGVVVVDDDANDSGRGIAVSIWNKKLRLGFRFYHLSSNIVKEGQQIKAGDIIGSSGNTDGNGKISTGPHLHFEIVRTDKDAKAIGEYGGAIDPLDQTLFKFILN